MTLAAFTWLPLDTWIVVVGALSAMACALLGNYLVLRKMSMMGDAISHAVLPGLALAFLITGSRNPAVMLVGAAVIGVLTAVFTEWIHTVGRVDQGAAMGVVFTILFAIGLILIRQSADHVDLDPECVLYGAIEYAPLDTWSIGPWHVPRAALINGSALLINAIFVLVFYKELKLSSFDPALATALGFNARGLHYALMTLVAITTVAAFESVGSILVIAMLIVPPAAAHLLTDRLSRMILLSLVIAAASALLGHFGAIFVPGWFGYTALSTTTSGMVAVAAGVLFLAALLLAPRRGLLSQVVHRLALSLRIAREDVLGLIFRIQEAGLSAATRDLLQKGTVVMGRRWAGLALWSLQRDRHVARAADGYRLTPAGRTVAGRLVRSHRLWETFLERHLALPADHVHPTAERLEHVTSTQLQAQLARSLGDPQRDPHGTPIPDSGPPAPSAP